jgi:hypothetical protein
VPVSFNIQVANKKVIAGILFIKPVVYRFEEKGIHTQIWQRGWCFLLTPEVRISAPVRYESLVQRFVREPVAKARLVKWDARVLHPMRINPINVRQHQ